MIIEERTAYIKGDTVTANLLDRINRLTEALGQALAEIEELKQCLRQQ